jgi:hypothetical protein
MAVAVFIPGVAPLVVAGLPPLVVVAGFAASDGGGGEGGRRPLDDLVELTAIEPHAAALGTKVDLHALT